MRHVAVLVLLWTGVGVTVSGALGTAALTDVRDRLHLLGPVTSLGVPLVGAAAVVQLGPGLAAGQVVVTVLLLLVTGPAVTTALARVERQRRLGSAQEPE